jgi:SAM-dependent methyltransferase
VLAQRWRPLESSQSGRVELGDFGRCPPALERDDDSVCDALVRRFLHARVSALAGRGLVIADEVEPDWIEALSASAEVESVSMGRCAGPDVARSTEVDWVVLDRCLQRLPEPANVLDEAVRRLKPGARLITLLTGIARAEKSEHAPLWNAAPYAARRLHEGHNELEHVEVEQNGNVTLALAWLYRLPACGLTERELAAVDPAYPLLVAVTATRRGRRT